jgi:hypothetical protein
MAGAPPAADGVESGNHVLQGAERTANLNMRVRNVDEGAIVRTDVFERGSFTLYYPMLGATHSIEAPRRVGTGEVERRLIGCIEGPAEGWTHALLLTSTSNTRCTSGEGVGHGEDVSDLPSPVPTSFIGSPLKRVPRKSRSLCSLRPSQGPAPGGMGDGSSDERLRGRPESHPVHDTSRPVCPTGD